MICWMQFLMEKVIGEKAAFKQPQGKKEQQKQGDF